MTMITKKRLSIALAFLFVSFGAFAQTADGILGSGEYQSINTYAGMRLGVTLSADGNILNIALEAPTSGWVAVGLGSLKMNGAFVVIGNDINGTTTISEETGKGHGHKANPTKILTESAIRESAGKTVLEFSIPAARFVDSNKMKMILAYGKKDKLSSMHADFESVEIAVTPR